MDIANPPASLPELKVQNIEVPLERDVFLRTLIRELSGTLQDVVGIAESSGFVALVGQRMGHHLNAMYRNALGVPRLTESQIADVLVDLKARIKGEFFIIEHTSERIVFGNTRCPFEDKVIGRPSMCMMTSNVFGSITAENLGYAKVELQETIANGDPGCRVIVHLQENKESLQVVGREYFRSEAQ